MPLGRTSSRLLLSTKAARCRQQRNWETFLYLTVWLGHWPNHPPSEYESRNTKSIELFEKQRIVGFCHHKLFALLRSNGSHGFSHFVFEVAFYTLIAVRASDHPQHSRDRRHWSSDWKLCGDATSRAVFFTQRSDLFTGFAYGHVTWRLDLQRSSWNFGRCFFFWPVAYLVILKMYMICFSNKSGLGCTCNTSTAYICTCIYMYVHINIYIDIFT